jgi:hypothetical protein
MLSDNKEFIDFLEDVSRNMKPETMDKIKTLLKGNLNISCAFVFEFFERYIKNDVPSCFDVEMIMDSYL